MGGHGKGEHQGNLVLEGLVGRASMVDRDSSSGGTRSGSSGRTWPAPAVATSFATVSIDSAATSATELLTPGQASPLVRMTWVWGTISIEQVTLDLRR